MKCLVLVQFLPGGSLPPEEFFRRLNARWQWLGDGDGEPGKTLSESTGRAPSVRSAVCIADYESIEQLTIDLAIMPGAGISSVEVVPISEEQEDECRSGAISDLALPLRYSETHRVCG